MDQRFELVLTPKKAPTDAKAFAKHVLSDLRGLIILDAELFGATSVVVHAELQGIRERHTMDELRGTISILTDRAGVELSVVHLLKR